MNTRLLRSRINAFLALMFVGAFTFFAWFIVWQMAFGQNPIADAMAAQLNVIQAR